MNFFKHSKKLHTIFITTYILLFAIPIMGFIETINWVIKYKDLSTIFHMGQLLYLIFIFALALSIFLHLKLKNKQLIIFHKAFIVLTLINTLILAGFLLWIYYRTIILGDEWAGLLIILVGPVMLLLWFISLINGILAFKKTKNRSIQ